jgi:ATP-binding cassette subfamily F protein 3
MLEEAIQDFEGSVIAVSHDRYFLRKIATRILQVGVNPIVTPAKAVDRRPELL